MIGADVVRRLRSPVSTLRGRGRVLLAAVGVFVGVGALYGGVNLIVDAEGFGMEASWLEGTPFSDYTVPGIALLVMIGGGMLVAAGLAVLGSEYAAIAAVVMGVTTLGFLTVETFVIGYEGSRQLPLVATITVAALVLVGLGWHELGMPPRPCKRGERDG